MSTLKGKHGEARNRTEVPRKTIVTALNAIGPLISTDTKEHALSIAVSGSSETSQPFDVVEQ